MDDLLKAIERSRQGLLDLSARNRLISTPRDAKRGKRIDIINERSEEIFRLLVGERKALAFLPGEDEDGSLDPNAPTLAQPEDALSDDGVLDSRHTDLRLQTRLGSERLQARLLSMYYDTQTYEQEQGVSILYLAAGFLEWFESPSSDRARHAPWS